MSETTSTVPAVNVDYKTIVTLRTIEGKSVQEVADHFKITWKEAAEAIRAYGLVVAKSEKAPDLLKQPAYTINLVDTAKVVPAKPKKEKVLAD